MSLLFPRIFDILDPEVEVAVEFAGGSVKDEENTPLAAVSGGANAQALHSFLAEGLEVHLVLDISDKVNGLGAARIELVLKVRPLLDDRGNFILAFNVS